MEAKLLIIEDEERLRSSLQEYFEREGFGVAVAEDGDRALDMLNEANPDLIILDVQLPHVDGLEVCRAVRQQLGHAVGIIMISGIKEVSNPLQSVQTNLDNMASCSLDEAGRWRQYHAIITAEVRRLSGLTENLRLLSHLETPGAPLVREPVNLKAVIESVIMALFEMAEARGMRLRYVGPERPARVLGDRDSLRQVLINLVDNGIKYSRPEGGEVIISVQEGEDRLYVRVSDEGMGIPEEDLPHIPLKITRPHMESLPTILSWCMLSKVFMGSSWGMKLVSGWRALF